MDSGRKCPFCESIDTEVLGYETLQRKGTRSIKGKNAIFEYNFLVEEALCLSCGYVFKGMKHKMLDLYNRERETFIEDKSP
ncbi:MAG TPA: hypothetical protein VF941_20330 [Clostridia bacterium]